MNLFRAVDFCPQCHFMLELSQVLDTIECNGCGYKVCNKCSKSDYQPKLIISTIKMESKSRLSNQLQEFKLFNQLHRAIIQQAFQKMCSLRNLLFYSSNKISIEGSRAFYESVKCLFCYQLDI